MSSQPPNSDDRIIIRNKDDLSLIYAPGVTFPQKEIIVIPDKHYDLTVKKNAIAMVTDGSDMEGVNLNDSRTIISILEDRAAILKTLGNIDVFPLCLNTHDPEEIVAVIRNILPMFAGVNIGDMECQKTLEVEAMLQGTGVPIYCDQLHGKTVVLWAALMNSLILAGKKMKDIKIVINGTGTFETFLLDLCLGCPSDGGTIQTTGDILVCDAMGVINKNREDTMTQMHKSRIAQMTNKNDFRGSLRDAIQGADVYISLSPGDTFHEEMVLEMADKSIVFDLTYPTPSFSTEKAAKSGAFIVATAHRGFSNYLNGELVSAGILRGMLDGGASRLTRKMAIAAASALAQSVPQITIGNILPPEPEPKMTHGIAEAVQETLIEERT